MYQVIRQDSTQIEEPILFRLFFGWSRNHSHPSYWCQNPFNCTFLMSPKILLLIPTVAALVQTQHLLSPGLLRQAAVGTFSSTAPFQSPLTLLLVAF